jgi:hypothetical protein
MMDENETNDPANPQYARAERYESGSIILRGSDGAICGAIGGVNVGPYWWIKNSLDHGEWDYDDYQYHSWYGASWSPDYMPIETFCAYKELAFLPVRGSYCMDMSQCDIPDDFYCDKVLDNCDNCEDIDFSACPSAGQVCGMNYHLDGDKVTVCHNGNTLVINLNALNALLAQGAVVGDC